MANEKPDLNALAKAGSNAQTAAKPATVDLSGLYGEHGGLVWAPPPTAGSPVDLSELYGEHGGLVE